MLDKMDSTVPVSGAPYFAGVVLTPLTPAERAALPKKYRSKVVQTQRDAHTKFCHKAGRGRGATKGTL